MTPTVRAALTLGIFGAMLALVIGKPRGYSEAVWTVLGAAALLGLGISAALVARSAIAGADAGEAAVYGALLGTNIGPNIVPFGSLATMLVLGVARKKGQPIRGVEVLKTGTWMTPLVLLAALAALALSFALRR